MNAEPLVPSTWTTGTTEGIETGTWRAALPRHIHAPSPCHVACPVNGDIAEWIGLARAHDVRGAWDVLTRHNPFPAVAGRVCHHPCETACNRGGFDEPLAICRLERYVGDRALAEGFAFPEIDTTRRECVAIVGGGPSGLSAAFHLRRCGYAVTLFEATADLGGLMRHGIPAYRLPRPTLDAEIARIVALGVDVRCNEAFTKPDDLARLRAEFDAVYVAVGANRQKRLPQLDYAQSWVVDGAHYLACASAGTPPALGERVLVVGGGSAAIDAARTARRAGHEVTVLALESEAQMPAQRDEVVEAIEEGVMLVAGAMLTAATPEAGGITVRCVRVRFEPGAKRGQFRIAALPDSAFSLAVDSIVTSIGQDPDLVPFAPAFRSDGALLAVDARQATSVEGVYAGGDVASMARFVTEAIGMGKRAAREIDRALRRRAAHGDGESADDANAAEAIVGLAAINTFYYPQQARATERRSDAAARVAGDVEVQLGFDVEQALAETTRCFSCGTCIECDNCVHYCPDLAVKRANGGYVVLTDYCKGCGLCVAECPTGSMTMLEEAR
jgi:NADPH-dependent glutamate synthase beta subunit-like oxidoreductase